MSTLGVLLSRFNVCACLCSYSVFKGREEWQSIDVCNSSVNKHCSFDLLSLFGQRDCFMGS